MRFVHADGTVVHLSYCTNVHPARDLEGVRDQLTRYSARVRHELGVPLLGVGLWLAAPVAARLVAEPVELAALRTLLDREGLEVVTLNGFPYDDFGTGRVKKRVYSPDWSQGERLRYTCDLAEVLAALLPEDARRGSISTLPLGWRSPWSGDRQALAEAQLDLLAARLDDLEQRTGRSIRVAMEPEPGCVVETTAQAVERLAEVDRRRVGVCLDTAHLAVAWEDPAAAVERLDAAGLQVVKAQLSSALHVEAPGATAEVLREFDEDRYLHQVRPGGTHGEAGHRGWDDLGEALDAGDGSDGSPWRVHFHLPLGAEPAAPLASTRGTLTDVLERLVGGETARTDHLDVESYTWSVLPHPPRTEDELVRGIAAELAWAHDALLAAGLKEAS